MYYQGKQSTRISSSNKKCIHELLLLLLLLIVMLLLGVLFPFISRTFLPSEIGLFLFYCIIIPFFLYFLHIFRRCLCRRPQSSLQSLPTQLLASIYVCRDRPRGALVSEAMKPQRVSDERQGGIRE